MEMKDDEFQTLRLRVDHISSELDKQDKVRAVNKKWMLTAGTVIVAALGYTNFVQLPKEAAEAAKEQIGPETIDQAKEILSRLEDKETQAEEIGRRLGEISDLKKIANLPVGTIIPSMLDSRLFAVAVGDDPNHFNPGNSNWVLADGKENITKSRYGQLSGRTTPPDLRGMFLRGINYGRNDGREDPNDREPGSYQKDALQEHDHKTTATGYQYKVRDEDSHYKWGSADLGYVGDGDADIVPADVTSVRDPRKSDEETRPKNVAVYFYIKIN